MENKGQRFSIKDNIFLPPNLDDILDECTAQWVCEMVTDVYLQHKQCVTVVEELSAMLIWLK